MKEGVVLTLDILDRCFNCGNKFPAKGIYDFYCSKKCEKEDQDRITKGIEEGVHHHELFMEGIDKVTK